LLLVSLQLWLDTEREGTVIIKVWDRGG
jgi:hypothetical protein